MKDEPVLIARYIDVRQAEFALSILEGSGIDGFLDQPYTASIAPHYMLGSGGVRLFVRLEDRDRALEVLADSGEIAAEDDA
ncbi:MAG TPA: DUF2007 domain-containing protein [Thermoanaerobaculia bacterium]|nr:DUF2007 domain-containing protein [Thermoanaerobaculia bacterium]